MGQAPGERADAHTPRYDAEETGDPTGRAESRIEELAREALIEALHLDPMIATAETSHHHRDDGTDRTCLTARSGRMVRLRGKPCQPKHLGCRQREPTLPGPCRVPIGRHGCSIVLPMELRLDRDQVSAKWFVHGAPVGRVQPADESIARKRAPTFLRGFVENL